MTARSVEALDCAIGTVNAAWKYLEPTETPLIH